MLDIEALVKKVLRLWLRPRRDYANIRALKHCLFALCLTLSNQKAFL